MMTNIQAQVKASKETEQYFLSERYGFNKLIGYSPIFKKAKTLAKQIAQTDTTLLITGESGTGKDVFAKAIHYDGIRKNGPFIRVNCAAIPEQLLESELFGYSEGTFTGAIKGGKKGKFELANRGTIFLDEIGEMPLSMQAKLLVVLQDKEIEPLGNQSEHPKKVDVRIIAATNQDLQRMVSEGSFRQDLFYRLNVINLHLPPLRHRKEDILPLGTHILNGIASRNSLQVKRCEPETEKIMTQYDWPGNVRELENCIESALWMASLEGQTTIGPKYMQEVFSKYISNPVFQHPGFVIPIAQSSQLPTMKDYMNLCEKRLLEEVLITTMGNKQAAAKILDLHISALYKKINKHGLTT
jgi:transcriptional regulator with PAS, ATPase and Fis domain